MEGLLKHAATLLQHVVGSVVDSAPHAQVRPALIRGPCASAAQCSTLCVRHRLQYEDMLQRAGQALGII